MVIKQMNEEALILSDQIDPKNGSDIYYMFSVLC